MGQRANPYGLRLGINKTHQSIWFAKNKKEYGEFVLQDHQIRTLISKQFRRAGVSSILISRSNQITVTINAKFVGHVIGKKGAIIDVLRSDLEKLCKSQVTVNVNAIAKPDLDAAIVANDIALALEGRGSNFKIVVKKTMQTTMEAGALGIKIFLSGRLGGAEIARCEPFATGSVPLQTLQADISYAQATSYTAAGTIGVKVFIYTGMYRGKYNPFVNLSDRLSQKANNQLNRVNEELDSAKH